jgi:hypothetical protein
MLAGQQRNASTIKICSACKEQFITVSASGIFTSMHKPFQEIVIQTAVRIYGL